VGRYEGLLDGVLGLLLGPEQVTAEAEDSGGVPLVEHLEGSVVAGADEVDEP
jgi:hypothetical protein